MRRALYLLTFTLAAAISGMMLWQWKVYSEDQEQLKKQRLAAEQQIHIEQTAQRLSVKQTLIGLKAGTYTIENPMEIAYTIEGREEMAPSAVTIAANESEITFVYDIPFDTNGSSRLFTDWAVELTDVDMMKTKVELTVTEGRRDGSWAAGAPLIGMSKKDHVDYYLFENEGSIYPLYYQTGQLLYEGIGTNAGLFYEEGTEVGEIKNILEESAFMNNYLAILTSEHIPFESQNLYLFSSRQPIDELKNRIAAMEVNTVFPFGKDDERWLQQILYSLANDTETGGEKAKQMIQVLKQTLLENETDFFIQSVKQMDEPLSATLLDEALSRALNKDTAFFSLNSFEAAALVPLFYYDEQKLTLNGTEVEQPIIYFESRKLVPFLPLIAHAGFQYERIDTGEVVLTREEDVLRMYPGQNVFIFNGTDYSVKSSPVILLGNELYISENWLRDIFGVKLIEQQGYLVAQ